MRMGWKVCGMEVKNNTLFHNHLPSVWIWTSDDSMTLRVHFKFSGRVTLPLKVDSAGYPTHNGDVLNQNVQKSPTTPLIDGF